MDPVFQVLAGDHGPPTVCDEWGCPQYTQMILEKLLRTSIGDVTFFFWKYAGCGVTLLGQFVDVTNMDSRTVDKKTGF